MMSTQAKRTRHRLALTSALAAMSACVPAARADDVPPDPLLLAQPGFLDAHPDLRWRGEGVRSLERGRLREAQVYFRRAARYADKPSQAMLGELHWSGSGGLVDRASGYAWMDLAAERGYPAFLALRERYWAALAEDERVRAVALGGELYAQYADDVAKPRLARVLERARRNVTGSRLGIAGTLKMQVYGPGGWTTMDGSIYYQSRLSKADEYWQWQDQEWRRPPRGHVTIGPIGPAESAPTPRE
ncbi:MAG: sel1 repeat family protein [Xanthomonadales bacterium]|nr:sel1 repeat family protein [Xanthomonadales bacterium]